MLNVSIPFVVSQDEPEVNIEVKSLLIDVTENTLKKVHEQVRSQLQAIIEEEEQLTVHNVTFQENPRYPGRGLIICSAYPKLIVRILDNEPPPEYKDTKTDRQRRFEAQEHLERLK